MQPRRRYNNHCRNTLHALWVFFSLSSKSIRNSHKILVGSHRKFIVKKGIYWKLQTIDINNIMGGNHKRMEATTIDKWRNSSHVKVVLQATKMTYFMECMQEKRPGITRIFKKGWNKGELIIGNRKVKATKTMIIEAMGLLMDKIKF